MMKRRTALGVIGAAGLTPYLMTSRRAHAALDLDTNNPDHVLTIYRKLTSAMDDRVIFFWLKSTRYGLVDSAFTPFWDVHIGAIVKSETIDDNGSFEATRVSTVFYTDVETGEYLETFKNPYTGEEVEIGYFPPTPGKRTYSRDGEAAERSPLPGYSVTGHSPMGPAWIIGDDVWVRGYGSFRLNPDDPASNSLIQINDQSTYHGSLAQVADPEVKSVPATWAFNDLNTWPAWLGMGDRPGNYYSRGFGKKVESTDEMPARWRELMAERHPDILSDPASALEG